MSAYNTTLARGLGCVFKVTLTLTFDVIFKGKLKNAFFHVWVLLEVWGVFFKVTLTKQGTL
jgi:hypothetical protein